MKFTIEIAQDIQDWKTHKEINTKLFTQVIKKILGKYPNLNAIKNVELSILLTNDAKIKELNKEFRNKNATTNVLSFPDLEIDYRKIHQFQPDDLAYLYLGDIAFSLDTITKEAEEKNIEFLQHFKHLLVHSILHLLGFDHQNDEEAEIMETLEVEFLKEFDIKSPY